MDDINFDELDQAVNSAMKPSDDKPIDNTPPASSPVDNESTDTSNQTVAPEAPRTASALPTKRRGQFMDIVHTANARPVAAPSVNRHSSNIKPLDPELIKVSGENPSVKSDSAETAVDESFTDTPVDNKNTDVDPELGSEMNAPVTTPFVEGVPVEKRPLGAFTGNELTADGPDDMFDSNDQPNVEEPAVLTSVQDTETITATNEPVATETQPDGPWENKPLDSISVEDTPSEPDTYSVPASPEEGVAQSIPQQYHVDHSFGNEEEHAVFDTTQYHQPLLPPAKPRHGHKILMYILLVVLMLAIGSAAGYAIFVLKLF